MGNHMVYLLIIFFAPMFTLSVSGANGQVPDGVVYTDLHKTVQKGYRVVLKCQFYGQPVAVYWKKGTNPTTSPDLITWVDGEQASGSCVTDGSCEFGDEFSLVIKAAAIADNGRYICRVSNYLGILLHNYTDLTVFAYPREPYPVISECQEMAPNTTCSITSYIPINITCSVTNYFPDIDLFFLGNAKEVVASVVHDGVNDDGTKNKSITIKAVYGRWTYVCIASDIPGSAVRRTAQANVNLFRTVTSSLTTASAIINQNEMRIIEIVAPSSFFALLLIVAVIVSIYLYHRKHTRTKDDPERGDGSPVIRIKEISFYELWFLTHCMDEYIDEEEWCNFLYALEINSVGLTKAQIYRALCTWKDDQTPDCQGDVLQRAFKKAGCHNAFKTLYDERNGRLNQTQPSRDTLNYILWEIGDPEKINEFLCELMPDPTVNCDGTMKDIIDKAVEKLVRWCEGSLGLNPIVLLSLGLERAECKPIDREFFIVSDDALEAISKDALDEFETLLTLTHCTKIGKSLGMTMDEFNVFLTGSESVSLYDTRSMISDWIRNEGCSNTQKRLRLNCALTSAGRDDLKGYFGDTESLRMITEDEENVVSEGAGPKDNHGRTEPAEYNEHEEVTEREIRRIASYLPSSDVISFGEGDDPVKVIEQWIKSLQEKGAKEDCRRKLHDTLRSTGLEALMPLQSKDKLYLIELLDIAYRLLLTDILPLASALGISSQRLAKYKVPFSPEQLSNGMVKMLVKGAKNDRAKLCNVLEKAGYEDIASMLKYGYTISLADMFSLEYSPIPNSSQRADLQQNLGITTDHDDFVPILKHWMTMFHPPSYNHRSALADAVHPVLGKDKALAVLSGKYRQSGHQIEHVTKEIREGVQRAEICRLLQILEAPQPAEGADLMTHLNFLDDTLHRHSPSEEDVRKIGEAGFTEFSRELSKVIDESNRHPRECLENDVSSRMAAVLGVKAQTCLASTFDAWLRKGPLKEDKRRDLSDRLLKAGYQQFAHEIMTGFAPKKKRAYSNTKCSYPLD